MIQRIKKKIKCMIKNYEKDQCLYKFGGQFTKKTRTKSCP